MSLDYLTLLIELPGLITSLGQQETVRVAPDEHQYMVDFHQRQVIART